MAPGSPYRMTPQRKVVLEEIRKVFSHPSAREVYRMVRRRMPRISLGTVYRSLDLLCEKGLIQKLPSQGGASNRFDGNPDTHVHVSCGQCERIDDLPMPGRRGLEKKAAKQTKFLIVGHRLEFLGVCPECQKKNKRKKHARGESR